MGRLGLSPLVVALLAVALVLRLAWVLVHPVDPVSDFLEYHKHAENLARHWIYSSDPAYRDAYWPPGWPLVLGLGYLVVGVHPHAGALLGATLEWGAIVLAAVAATRLLRPRFAAAAVAAMCLYPSGIAFAPVLGTEHLAALLFTGLVVLVAFGRPSPATALGAGLLAGGLILVRGDVGIAAAMVAAVWLLRAPPRRLAALAVAGALVFIGPWTVRNANEFGEFIPTSTNGGVTFYLGTLAAEYTSPALVERLGSTSTEHPKAHENHYYRLGLDNLREHPLRWLRFDAERVYLMYGRESPILRWGELRETWTVRVAASAYWLVILALAVAGLATIAAERRRLPGAWTTIAASILLATLLKLPFLVEARQRLVLVYLLIVIAGLGAQRLAALGPKRLPGLS